MTEKERFTAAVARMRACGVGTVDVRDWPSAGRPAYRMASLRIEERAAEVPARAADLAAFAMELGGYLVMYSHGDHGTFDLMLMRDLDAEETHALQRTQVPGRACVPVQLEAA